MILKTDFHQKKPKPSKYFIFFRYIFKEVLTVFQGLNSDFHFIARSYFPYFFFFYKGIQSSSILDIGDIQLKKYMHQREPVIAFYLKGKKKLIKVFPCVTHMHIYIYIGLNN